MKEPIKDKLEKLKKTKAECEKKLDGLVQSKQKIEVDYQNVLKKWAGEYNKAMSEYNKITGGIETLESFAIPEAGSKEAKSER